MSKLIESIDNTYSEFSKALSIAHDVLVDISIPELHYLVRAYRRLRKAIRTPSHDDVIRNGAAELELLREAIDKEISPDQLRFNKFLRDMFSLRNIGYISVGLMALFLTDSPAQVLLKELSRNPLNFLPMYMDTLFKGSFMMLEDIGLLMNNLARMNPIEAVNQSMHIRTGLSLIVLGLGSHEFYKKLKSKFQG